MGNLPDGSYVNLYHQQPNISVLGPGKRFGIWFQGCSFKCPGCLVPDSQTQGGTRWSVSELVETILSSGEIEGVTISGGEPFQQPTALAALLQQLYQQHPRLSVMVFSGYRYPWLQAHYPEILNHIDILVDGLYQQEFSIKDPWRGSSNQQIHYLSDRYNTSHHQQVINKPSFELFITQHGVFYAGVPNQWERIIIEQLEGRLAK